MSAANLQFQTLSATHDRAAFDCDQQSLNSYLQHYARQNARRDYGVTFVAFFPDNSRQIAAYYTLANSKIGPTQWPEGVKKPPLDAPTILLARLGVDRNFQGQGVGVSCMDDIFRRTIEVSQLSGVAALEVEALDERAARYYAHYDFTALRDEPLHLYLPIARIRQFLADDAVV